VIFFKHLDRRHGQDGTTSPTRRPATCRNWNYTMKNNNTIIISYLNIVPANVGCLGFVQAHGPGFPSSCKVHELRVIPAPALFALPVALKTKIFKPLYYCYFFSGLGTTILFLLLLFLLLRFPVSQFSAAALQLCQYFFVFTICIIFQFSIYKKLQF
jgi:hypothetical protein